MTNSFFSQAFVAGYALDILEERAEFESDLAASESLQAKLSTFEFAVGELAYGVPTVPLPTDLKGRLFDNISEPETDDSFTKCGLCPIDNRPPYTDIVGSYPKPPIQNRLINDDVRGMRVGIQPR
jgi:hypothetical protein